MLCGGSLESSVSVKDRLSMNPTPLNHGAIRNLLLTVLLLSLWIAGCSTTPPEPRIAAFPLPPIIFHQPDEVVAPRVKDPKAFATFIRALQSRCDSYFTPMQPGKPQTIDVVVIVKPKNKSRILLAYEFPPANPTRDRALLDKLNRISAPPVEEGPVSFSMRLLLWGATEPNPRVPRGLFLPKEWRETTGTNQSPAIPEGITPQTRPGK